MTMLPADFVFSQGNLQDFVDCRRRFQLRHLLRIPWPAVESEPLEQNQDRRERGLALHRLIHQHNLDFPEERLSQSARALGLEEIWQCYLRCGPQFPAEQRYPEFFVAAPVAGYQVLAKLDLLVIEPGGKAVIIDWKTSRPRPRSWLASRMQTLVYRYLLGRAGPRLNLGGLLPESIEMVYWYVAEPEKSIRFRYDQASYRRDERALADMIREIEALPEDGFTLTEERSRCAFCSYRSLCERGQRAGSQSDFDEDAFTDDEFDLDWNQIAEVEF